MLVAEHVALQVVHGLRDVVPLVERADKDLGRQIRRAGSSVVLNVAEGARRMGKDRTHLYRVAAGSAAEVRAALLVAMAWGYVDEARCEEVLALLDRELRLLWGLTERKSPPSKRAAASAMR